MKKTTYKSDVSAKAAFVTELEKRGFTAQVIKAPADIKAVKDGQTWYFEIKMTKHTDRYFGAATMTEWKQALADSEHYRFVAAIDLGDGNWDFREYTPGEFMEFCTIPPFKVYFNIDFTGKRPGKTSKKSKAVRLSSENFRNLANAFEALDKG